MIDRRILKASFRELVADDVQRRRMQLEILLIVLSVISGGMTIVNIITGQHDLMIATAIFCLLSFVSAIVAYFDKNSLTLASGLFAIEVIGLFTYFIITGGTEGFSTIWLLLLPACGMFAFGIKNGSMLTATLLVELIFFFYSSIGRSLLLCSDYSDTFLLRFPFVYIAFWMVGIFLELVREETYSQLDESRKEFEFISDHDALTALYNRAGFDKKMSNAVDKFKRGEPFALMMMDLDFFKSVNDAYGHLAGDNVLRSVATVITDTLNGRNAVVSRWGGEEFSVILLGKDSEEHTAVAESIRAAVEQEIHDKAYDVHITISIGTVRSSKPNLTTASEMLRMADKMLYKAKDEGRNRVCYFNGTE